MSLVKCEENGRIGCVFIIDSYESELALLQYIRLCLVFFQSSFCIFFRLCLVVSQSSFCIVFFCVYEFGFNQVKFIVLSI